MKNRLLSIFILGILALVVASSVFTGGNKVIFASGTQNLIFQGVYVYHEERIDPRPLSIHVAVIDLDAPGIRLLVTPGDPEAEGIIPARTTSSFLDEFDLQVAVNGGFFSRPATGDWRDFFLANGNPLRVIGLASSEGAVYGRVHSRYPTLYIAADNRASFGEPIADVYNALSGDCLFVAFGQVQPHCTRYHLDLHPRTAVALDEGAEYLLLFVVDGRQSDFSEGITLPELGQIVLEYGGYTALNLDGGGSSALVIEDEYGQPNVLNSPIHNRRPGWQRPVANHLGIFAQRLPAEGQ